MSKQAKLEILKALGKGILSKVEAQTLIHANGKLILDLSSEALNADPIQSILEKIPDIKNHFVTVISLGNGKKP